MKQFGFNIRKDLLPLLDHAFYVNTCVTVIEACYQQLVCEKNTIFSIHLKPCKYWLSLFEEKTQYSMF